MLRALPTGPWAMRQQDLELFLARSDWLETQATARLFQAKPRAPRALKPTGGVVVVPVVGALMRGPNLVSSLLGLSTYAEIERQVRAAADDPEVRGIVLLVDSPGGDALGIASVSDAIREARDRKPVAAFVPALAASAGYVLAAQASEIVIARDAVLGSVGVVLTVLDFRRGEREAGLDRFEFVAAQSPRKRPDPQTESGSAQLQAEVDAIAEILIETTALGRRVTTERVLQDFGQGGILVGQAAVAAGLADRVGDIADAVAAFPASPSEMEARAKAAEAAEWRRLTALAAKHSDWGTGTGAWMWRRMREEGDLKTARAVLEPKRSPPPDPNADHWPTVLAVAADHGVETAPLEKLRDAGKTWAEGFEEFNKLRRERTADVGEYERLVRQRGTAEA